MTDIQLTFAPGTNLDMMVIYEMASRVWENYLGDDATVHIYVGASADLPSNVAGGALSGIAAYQQYDSFRTQLTADATSADDTTAVNSLKAGTSFDVMSGETLLADNSEMKLTRANAKAIGMVGGAETMLDGIILMNDLSTHPSVSWDYDAVDISVGSSELEAMSVALHEVGHILGYMSGLDAVGQEQSTVNQQIVTDDSSPQLSDNLSPITFTAQTDSTFNSLDLQVNPYVLLPEETHQVTPLDMFRASSQTSGQAIVNMTMGSNTYFSLDQGATNLGDFSGGANLVLGGDGYQASHWQDSSSPLGVMDPTIALGERMTIDNRDLTAFDVIGWDRQSATLDLASLELDAKTHLASQLGQTVAWLEGNATTAAASLTIDRAADVEAMVVESQIYNSLWGGGGGNWQEIVENLTNAMWKTGSFSTFDADSPAVEVSKTPVSPTPVYFPTSDLLTGSHDISAEDILDQGADELLNHGSLQPDQPETEPELEHTGGYSADPFALLGISHQPDHPLLGESNFGLDLPGGVATWFEGASLGVEAVFS